MLLNRCVTRAHSTTDAREALQDLGYDVLATAVPRLEVYAQSFGMPIPDTAARSGAMWPTISSSAALRWLGAICGDMTTQREQRKAQMAAAAARRTEPGARPAGPDRDPVEAGQDHPRPEPRALPAAHPVG